jgi:cyclophilin family peptidyl-prolyl cis-trans isomerase
MSRKKTSNLEQTTALSESQTLSSKAIFSDLVSRTGTDRTSLFVNTALLVVLLSGFVYFAFIGLPNLLDQTDDAKQKRLQVAVENREKNETARKLERQKDLLATDPENLTFVNRSAKISTNYGDIEIDLKDTVAPKTVESFVRLISRKYYDNTEFHRYVKGSEFTVLQGGDPKGDGTGGESAFITPLKDEIWKVSPTYGTDENNQRKITNIPEFIDASLYTDFSTTTGNATYKKGVVAMANSGPDTAGSQFFIALDATTLPPQYTIFGMVREPSFSVLDKIVKEVGVIVKNQGTQGFQSTTQDGKPDKELYIQSATML